MATVTQTNGTETRETVTSTMRLHPETVFDLKQAALDELRATGKQPTMADLIERAWKAFRADAKKGKRT